MFRYLFSFLLLTSLLTHTENQAQAANLVLNGSASYTHLTRDYYSAALYLEKPEQSVTAIKNSLSDKSMRLIVLTRWTKRKWKAHWQGNIAINNETLPNNRKQSEALMAFINLPQGNLEPGDDIRINASANSTQVYLNNELALSVPEQTLFLYVLNSWIGKFPPSREFRDQILGIKLNPEIRQQVENHTIPTTRLGLLTGWKAEQQLQLQLQQEQQLQLRQEQQAKLKQQQIQKQKIEQQRIEKELEQQRLLESQRKLAARQAEQRRLQAEAERAKKRKQEELTARIQQDKQAHHQAERQRQQAAVEQQYFKQHYHWRLQQALHNEINYPPWAKQFNQEGDIQTLLTLGEKGDVIAQQPMNTEQPELLIEEFQRALGVITTQVKPDPALRDAPWQLHLGHRFSLADDHLTVLPEPQRPKSLKNKAKTIEKAVQQTSYQQHVREQVIQSLVYPKAAQVLKKEGEVIMEIELDADGNIVLLTDKKLSRHRELNRAFKKAIQSSAPFGRVPGGEPIRMVISYQFRLR